MHSKYALVLLLFLFLVSFLPWRPLSQANPQHAGGRRIPASPYLKLGP